jgi:adenine-specific DNA-methyltransferase
MPTLTWTGKEDALRAASLVPFRLLEPHTAAEGGMVGDRKAAQDNLLIQGDNLEALKALLPYYAGRVKCIYIDPPYNTKSALEHYDDNLEHSIWLSLIYPRLELLREFLAADGSIWVSIDDREMPSLRQIMDEIFGRSRFIASIVWQKRYSRENREAIGDVHEYLLVYAPNPEKFKAIRNLVPFTGKQARVYKNPNNDPNGRWRPVPMTAQAGHATADQFYEIVAPSGKKFKPPAGRCWGLAQATYLRLLEEGRIYFGKNGNSQPNVIRYLSEVPGVAPWTWWPSDEVGHTDEAKKEILSLFGDEDIFDTPKPERLLSRIIAIATNPGDIILDSFLGSGTTMAVAMKMKRRCIGIEMGEHARTLCLPRLRKVVEGDRGGISEEIEWKGGGGFCFVKLGETLFDAFGRLNPKVKFADLAAFVWWRETKAPAIGRSIKATSPFLGVHEGRGLYLLYNGILGDKRPKGGNVLTPAVLASLPKHDGPRVIYAEATTYSPSSLARMNISFKQIPYALGSMPLLAEGALEYAAGLMPEAPRYLGGDAAGAGEDGEHV